jgi:hypothetical protein
MPGSVCVSCACACVRAFVRVCAHVCVCVVLTARAYIPAPYLARCHCRRFEKGCGKTHTAWAAPHMHAPGGLQRWWWWMVICGAYEKPTVPCSSCIYGLDLQISGQYLVCGSESATYATSNKRDFNALFQMAAVATEQ